MAGRATYDLILMDCQMPHMDGFETTRRLRAALAGRTPPVIAVTAGATNEDRRACEEAGMDDYAPKPLSLDAVQTMLHKWLAVEVSRPAGPSRSSR